MRYFITPTILIKTLETVRLNGLRIEYRRRCLSYDATTNEWKVTQRKSWREKEKTIILTISGEEAVKKMLER